jgi:hypothetical protein
MDIVLEARKMNNLSVEMTFSGADITWRRRGRDVVI